MSLNFTAIDFETANGTRGSVCAVGAVKVKDGAVVDTFTSLVNPPDSGGFSSFNISIHGIRPEHVIDAPRWPVLWPDLLDFVGPDALVAHNAAFDRSVWKAACALTGLHDPEPPFYCTVKLARRLLALPSHKLPLVAKALDLPDFSHHDATADAQACALIGIELSRRSGIHSVQEFGNPVGMTPRSRTASKR
ncbi:3'-5' exonuclease [Scrofimicrobium canadense]|nr:3'-5' exonuclease [Scrofimicrobium canadense]